MIPAFQDRSFKLIYFLFILSGLTSLVYEIVWSRILSTILGNTSLAISIVVSLFMAGLAGGSILAARYRPFQKKPLVVYGALELLIGLYSLCTPWLSDLINFIYGSFYEGVAHQFWLSVALKSGVTAVFFFLPTVAMGATLPVLIRSFTHSERQAKAGRLYGLNTFGAVLGTLLAGYVLIPFLGIRQTIFLAAALNLLICLTALHLSRSAKEEIEEPWRATAFHPVYLLVFFTGFASLCFEILWARALSMFFGSSVYAFSAILAAFLMGIAAGSSYYSNRISEQTNPYQFFTLIQFRLSLAAMFFVGIFMGIPLLLIWMFESLNHSFPLFQMGQFLLISSTVFYATFLSGASFPAALHFFRGRSRELHSHTAYIYTYNTIGGIFGSLTAAFLLIPLLGVEGSIRITVLIHLILGIYCFRKTQPADQDKRVLAIGGVTLILVLLLPYWNKSVYNAGFYAFAYKYVKQDGTGAFLTPAENTPRKNDQKPSKITYAGMLPASDFGPDLKMLFYGEGITATVAVVEDEQGIRSLLINGKPDASNVPMGDMRTQLLLGHLPVMLRGGARNALVIGLGSGVTSGALRTHGIQKIDCVEIEKKVALASQYFERENLSILKDPAFRLILDDGRNVVQHTPVKYDILTSEPSNLWISGVANLFTKEFFMAARNRLNPDGIMCQWIHLYQISLEDVLIFLKTFQSVFPHLTLWIDQSDMIVIGSGKPMKPTVERLQSAMDRPEVLQSLLRSNLTAQNIIKKYAGDERIIRALPANLPFNTDNHPILEFSAPKSLFWNRSVEIAQSLKTLGALVEGDRQKVKTAE